VFGIVDIAYPSELRIVDRYFMEYNADHPDAKAQGAAIDAQRTGQLNHTTLRG
jgi:hypothetical protein